MGVKVGGQREQAQYFSIKTKARPLVKFCKFVDARYSEFCSQFCNEIQGNSSLFSSGLSLGLEFTSQKTSAPIRILLKSSSNEVARQRTQQPNWRKGDARAQKGLRAAMFLCRESPSHGET